MSLENQCVFQLLEVEPFYGCNVTVFCSQHYFCENIILDRIVTIEHTIATILQRGHSFSTHDNPL